MISVIKKIIIIKEKEGKRQGKKTLDRRGSILGPLLQHNGCTTRPRGLSYLKSAKSFDLNKTDVIITVNTSNVV